MSIEGLLAANVVLHGFIAGISYDLALVKLNARKRLGNKPFADMVRATDLGPGMVAHSALGGPAILLSLGTFIYTLTATNLSSTLYAVLIAAGATTLLYAICSAKVVPLTLKLKNAKLTDDVLEATLSELAVWSQIRALLQIATFLLYVVALAA